MNWRQEDVNAKVKLDQTEISDAGQNRKPISKISKIRIEITNPYRNQKRFSCLKRR